ncbi:GtrA family protein [Phenylobacterium soli]|uniref:GtrA family protein n=1 Tax=Phenylobacterium soli TaxID=2170551 RepID=A0A328AFK6_9CAUL|nr:GtrA family protein [Phenylobacterium soli]RAK53429.1 GtrA family protein [Phenylobacterium soli]
MSLRADAATVRQGGTFLVVGLAATAVHAAASLAARELGHLAPTAATTVGYLCSVGISYLGNARFTFGRPALDGAQFVRFLVVSLIGFAANLGVTHLFAEVLKWPFVAALGVVVVVIPALSFTASKLWAFAERRA